LRPARGLAALAAHPMSIAAVVGAAAVPGAAAREPAASARTVATGAIVQERDWRDLHVSRGPAGVESFAVEIIFAANHIDIAPGDGDMLYDAHVRYDAGGKIRPLRSWNFVDGRATLRFSHLGPEDTPGITGPFEDEQAIERLSAPLDGLGSFSLLLNPRVRTTVETAVGGSDARLELGGLTLDLVRLYTAAAQMEVSFGAPNRTAMDTLVVATGAAVLRMERLGNARFRHFGFKSLLGLSKLDFSGDWEADAEMDLQVVLGDVEIHVPTTLGVEVVRGGGAVLVLASDFSEAQENDNILRSPNWFGAEHKLTIRVASDGLGLVRISRGYPEGRQ